MDSPDVRRVKQRGDSCMALFRILAVASGPQVPRHSLSSHGDTFRHGSSAPASLRMVVLVRATLRSTAFTYLTLVSGMTTTDAPFDLDDDPSRAWVGRRSSSTVSWTAACAGTRANRICATPRRSTFCRSGSIRAGFFFLFGADDDDDGCCCCCRCEEQCSITLSIWPIRRSAVVIKRRQKARSRTDRRDSAGRDSRMSITDRPSRSDAFRESSALPLLYRFMSAASARERAVAASSEVLCAFFASVDAIASSVTGFRVAARRLNGIAVARHDDVGPKPADAAAAAAAIGGLLRTCTRRSFGANAFAPRHCHTSQARDAPELRPRGRQRRRQPRCCAIILINLCMFLSMASKQNVKFHHTVFRIETSV
jgi:hypothetical protein